MLETFGPEYVRPAQIECPDCSCCSGDLCARGRTSIRRCEGHTADEARQIVRGCPCSGETKPLTAAWRAGMLRATKAATDKPLSAAADELLRLLVRGEGPSDPVTAGQFAALKSRGYAHHVDGQPAVTDTGRAYLRARDDGDRTAVTVLVLTVDMVARTARVECPAWRRGEGVTVLLDQLLSETGLPVEELPGRWLTAEGNLQAQLADHFVLSGFSAAPAVPTGPVTTIPLPVEEPVVPRWMRIGADGDGGDADE